jgi:hypothetical protein
MNFIKKIWAGEKAQFQKPEIRLVIGMVGGFLIGVGTDNIGLGVALAIALGASGYASCKKKNKKEDKDDMFSL